MLGLAAKPEVLHLISETHMVDDSYREMPSRGAAASLPVGPMLCGFFIRNAIISL